MPGLVKCAPHPAPAQATLRAEDTLGFPKAPCCSHPTPAARPSRASAGQSGLPGLPWAGVLPHSLNIACVLWIIVPDLDSPPTQPFSIPNLAGCTRDCFCRLLAGGSDIMWCPRPKGWGQGRCGCVCFELSRGLCIPVANIWR